MGQSQLARATRPIVVLVFVGSTVWTTSVTAAALHTEPPSRGPWIDRTLAGGVARDLSIEELRAVNRARGIAFAR